jgi:hypothetical protein
MHGQRRVGALVLLLLCLVAVVALAGGGVRIDSWLIGGGGRTRSTAGDVSMGSALGEAIAGRSGGGAVELQSGFWSGPRAQTGQAHTLYVPVILADY